ncbi:hypothetical protein GCM10007425_01410 [Lysinibacillus alkalisoli]|uniref:Helix-turn-helix domain-containing protein n=1 Tax=Lysinibacillus alkalisoli TaxID=1911548 RepID=A0A917FUU1_9BACI|nr:AraC family transcriptional regulator [Lysinibacillus alkalisoli]GGG10844.1 hypothetical protein GCM10007425_01410 [Lysinibacillus alkalisoli]
MNSSQYIHLWNDVDAIIVDIRHHSHHLDSKPLPSNAFIFVERGSTQITCQNELIMLSKFQTAHFIKGSKIQFVSSKDFSYYLIFYKVRKRDIKETTYDVLPWETNFYVTIQNAIPTWQLIYEMEQAWQTQYPLKKLQMKGLFHQFIYEVAKSQQQGIVAKRDSVADAIFYIQQHYAEPLTLDKIAHDLNYSAPHLSLLFKERTGQTMIDYVIQKRLQVASILLIETDATLQEIAQHIGYKDPYYFSRLFKEHQNCSPLQYRKRTVMNSQPTNHTKNIQLLSIVYDSLSRYIESDSQYEEEENLSMIANTKQSFVATLLICFSLLLTGCATDQAKTQSQNNATTSEMYTYKGANGEVEIPKHPKRVVVLADQLVGHVLALDVPIVGLSKLALQNPYFAGKVDGIESVGDTYSLEKITELKPDLIIALAGMDGYQEFEKIAPTVGIPYGEKNYKEQIEEFGIMLHREKEAQQWLQTWEASIAKVKPEIQQVVGEKTISIIGGTDKSLMAFSQNYGRGGEIVFGELELEMPDKVAQDTKETGWAQISMEVLQDYTGDYLIVENDSLPYLEKSPLWSELPAVQNNNIHIIDSKAAYFNDPVSLDRQLADLTAFFLP